MSAVDTLRVRGLREAYAGRTGRGPGGVPLTRTDETDRPATSVASTYRQSSLSLAEREVMGYVHEPPGLLLHVAGPDVMATHVVPSIDTAAITAHF